VAKCIQGNGRGGYSLLWGLGFVKVLKGWCGTGGTKEGYVTAKENVYSRAGGWRGWGLRRRWKRDGKSERVQGCMCPYSDKKLMTSW